MLISNNIIINGYYMIRDAIETSSNVSNIIINNNVIWGNINCYYSHLMNNIQYLGNFYNQSSSNTYFNNIGNSDQFGTENGNQVNVDMETIFVGTGSTDGQWQLADGSPAIAAGYSGEDCGAYGGIIPYKLSGIPSVIPAIYFFSAPAVGFELPIEIKAKSHN